MSAHFRGFLTHSPPLPPVVHTCPHFDLPLHPSLIRADTSLNMIRNFFGKYPTLNIHLHHPSPYAKTKKVSHKVKNLLTILTHDAIRQITNIYLNILWRLEKIVFVLRNLYTVLHGYINVLS